MPSDPVFQSELGYLLVLVLITEPRHEFKFIVFNHIMNGNTQYPSLEKNCGILKDKKCFWMEDQ